MTSEPTSNSPTKVALGELARLRQFTGPAKSFWPPFLSVVQRLTSADRLVLLARKPNEPWRRLLDWPQESPPSRLMTEFLSQTDEAATLAASENGCLRPLDKATGATARSFILAVPLHLPAQPEQCVLAGLFSEMNELRAREAWLRLGLAAPTAETFQTQLASRQAKADVEKFACVLDLIALLGNERRFLATALALCNDIATKFNCDRVSLGWLEHGYVRLRAISRTEKFDRQMAAAQALEVAMEEALDQDEEVGWPRWEGATVIARDHERFVKEQGAGHVFSLPLRSHEAPVAIVTCERLSAPFTETEWKQLRLVCDLATPRLADQQRQDRWFGARWTATLRENFAKVIGPEHTWAKALALLVTGLLAALFLLRVPYRVEGNFVLRSDETVFLTAPYEGYIDQVNARPGDKVGPGSPLLKLKTAELELDEEIAQADLNRFQREAEKARAAKSLAEMRISEAMAEQARARRDLARYRLGQASIVAPFDGVIIEGDLRERLGSPVKTAEVLFRVARTDKLYVEAEVNERDAHELLAVSAGEIAFVSQPRKKFPVRLVNLEQAAVAKEEANVFLARCALPAEAQAWWRPGMSGVCKFTVGKRRLFWILTHRTVDFLRLKLWW